MVNMVVTMWMVVMMLMVIKMTSHHLMTNMEIMMITIRLSIDQYDHYLDVIVLVNGVLDQLESRGSLLTLLVLRSP